MNFNEITIIILKYNQEHKMLLVLIVFFLAFCESLVFISLLFPATIILICLGVFISKSNTLFWPVLISTSLGAFFGDWFSYWFGFRYKENIRNIWPFSYNSKIIDKGYIFFKRWGIWCVFFSRFFGAFRAIVPLIAGIYNMPKYYFQFINIFSSVIWAFSILSPGLLWIHWFR
ncbi:DedA family protein [Candidatus Providencia siddallii]|uniref:DedA family protein n=1 Tax=Candidatus Providencia siddallii TaxID=1715285 RepID=A0ABM9NP66_9GAMM